MQLDLSKIPDKPKPATVPMPALDLSKIPDKPKPTNLPTAPTLDLSKIPDKKPQVAMPNASSMLKNAIKTGTDWATTSIMPDAEEAISDYSGKIPYIGDYVKPVVDVALKGATSPLGLATLGAGSLAIKALRGVPKVELPLGPITKEEALVDELKGATRLTRAQQDAATSIERGKRVKDYTQEMATLGKGEGAFDVAKGKLAGELPKIKYAPIRDKFATAGNEHIDNFHVQIENSPLLSPYDKVAAHNGLNKVLGSTGVEVSKPSEIDLLTKVFGPNFGKSLANKSGMKDQLVSLANTPRTIMASGDLSAPRQAAAMVGRSAFWKNLPALVKSIPESGYNKIISEVKSDPLYELASRSGVNFTDVNSFSAHEEMFASKIAKKYPGVLHSERAFTGFLNKVRMDAFADMATKIEKTGVAVDKDRKMATAIADWVNIGTGRGKLGETGERSLGVINAAFFSPRLAASRVQMFTQMFNPSVPKPIRIAYMRNAVSYLGAVATLLGTIKASGKADVNLDWTNPDFGKVKVGNTRVDFSAGVAPYVRALGQLINNQSTSSVSGKVTEFGKGYKPKTRLDVVSQFATQKAAPIPSAVMDTLRGTDTVGKPTTVGGEAYKLLTPLTFQDFSDMAKEEPDNLPLMIPGVLGANVQTYGPDDIQKAPTRKGPLKVVVPERAKRAR